MDLMVEASPRRIFANAHTYHINSISVNSDHETYLSADDLRINLWHLEITDRSFNIVDIKPVNMEELTEVITAAEFHPHQCNVFVYSSSKGTIRLCDMRSSALCDRHAKFFEEPEDPSSRSFFSEIISSISDVKFSHSGRYMMTRDYLSVKVWDLNMESRPVETHQVHEYLRSKLCSLYENDCIFDKFECCWSGSDRNTLIPRPHRTPPRLDSGSPPPKAGHASSAEPGGLLTDRPPASPAGARAPRAAAAHVLQIPITHLPRQRLTPTTPDPPPPRVRLSPSAAWVLTSAPGRHADINTAQGTLTAAGPWDRAGRGGQPAWVPCWGAQERAPGHPPGGSDDPDRQEPSRAQDLGAGSTCGDLRTDTPSGSATTVHAGRGLLRDC
uniref:Serine/threonine-protein phosphatase 2A 55 kDa regulatory subunit B n=1 Tax=Canis lupus familiaris TaxID=9615 RepID=A0A8C0PJ70_CANLF